MRCRGSLPMYDTAYAMRLGNNRVLHQRSLDDMANCLIFQSRGSVLCWIGELAWELDAFQAEGLVSTGLENNEVLM